MGFYHLDVAGHGIPSALLSVTLSKVLSPAADQHSPLKRLRPTPPHDEILSPSEVLDTLNRQFQSHDDNAPSFTMVYGIIDTQTARVTLTQAGHTSPGYLPKGGKAVLVGTGGFLVGILPRVEYETLTLDSQPGDRLGLYSDGVTECMHKANALYTEVRLTRYLENASTLPLDVVMQNLERYLRAWKGDTAFEDDVSVLAFEAL